MSKSLTFYLLNHYQGVIILVYVWYYKLGTFNITNFDFSICLSRKLYRGLHYLGMHTHYSRSLIY